MSAGSLNAAKLKGMCSPGPDTIGWPKVAAEAGAATAAEPATAERAAREAILRTLAFMVRAPGFIRGVQGTVQGSALAPGRGAHQGVGLPHLGGASPPRERAAGRPAREEAAADEGALEGV